MSNSVFLIFSLGLLISRAKHWKINLDYATYENDKSIMLEKLLPETDMLRRVIYGFIIFIYALYTGFYVLVALWSNSLGLSYLVFLSFLQCALTAINCYDSKAIVSPPRNSSESWLHTFAWTRNIYIFDVVYNVIVAVTAARLIFAN